MLRIAVAGVTGRMGRALVEAISRNPEVTLGAASVSSRSADVGKDAGVLFGMEPLQVKTVTDLSRCLDEFDTLIDFTTPVSLFR